MIVMILVLIWVVALTPFLLRRLSEHQLASSVVKFRAATGMLRRAYPKLVAVRSVNRTPGEIARSTAERRRAEHARAKRQIERRKQLLFRLVGGTAATLVLGGLPHLHALWNLSIVGAILTTGYVGMLAYLAHQPAPLPTMRRPSPAVGPHDTEHSSERLVASGGGSPMMVTPMPRRPAFVVVRPNS
jgi:hypothetical protein